MKTKILGYLLIAALAAGAGAWFAQKLADRRAATEAARAAEIHQAELAQIRGQAVAWADQIARDQGRAVLRSFAAGITPDILTGRRESLEISAVGLLRVTGVKGVHLLGPEGLLLYSSDAKLGTTGNTGEGGAWAFAAAELTSRPSSAPGVTELAVPILDGGRKVAVVWLEFAQDSVRDQERPQSLRPPAEPASLEAAGAANL